MQIQDYAGRLASLAVTFQKWLSLARRLDDHRREKVALYAEEIAATLGRASSALAALEGSPCDPGLLLAATRELGRISGYLETIVTAFSHHLDGRKRAGVKRRLEKLEPLDLEAAIREIGAFRHARRLTSAEGYFRAVADALRA